MALLGIRRLARAGFASAATQPTDDPSACTSGFRTVEPDVKGYPVGGNLNASYSQGILENTGNVCFVVKGQFTHSLKE